MVKWLMKRGIAAFERQWNYDASYVHELIEADPRAVRIGSFLDRIRVCVLDNCPRGN